MGTTFPSVGILSSVMSSLLWFGKGGETVHIYRKKLVATVESVVVVFGSRGTMGKWRCELAKRVWTTPKGQNYQYLSCYQSWAPLAPTMAPPTLFRER